MVSALYIFFSRASYTPPVAWFLLPLRRRRRRHLFLWPFAHIHPLIHSASSLLPFPSLVPASPSSIRVTASRTLEVTATLSFVTQRHDAPTQRITPRSVDTTYNDDKFADFSTREISRVSELSEIFSSDEWATRVWGYIASE